QVLFFVDKVRAVILAHLVVWSELDRVGGARVLAEPAVDAAVEIDPEELRKPPPMFILGRLQRDAGDGAHHGAQVASYAPFAAVGVARQDDPTAPPRRHVSLLFRILNRRPPMEHVPEDDPQAVQHAQHRLLRLHPRATTIAPVTTRFTRARGSITFQPYA